MRNYGDSRRFLKAHFVPTTFSPGRLLAIPGRFFLRLKRSPCFSPLFLLSLFLAASAASARTIRVGVYENKPKVTVTAEGEGGGIFIELLDKIAEAEGWTLEYVPGDWSECLERLVAGEIDLMPDVAYSAARSQSYYFGSEPVLYSWFQVYRHPRVAIETIFDLNGKKVVVLHKSIQHRVVSSTFAGYGIKCDLITAPTYHKAFEMVSRREADAVITNRFFGEEHKEQYNLKETDVIFYPSRLHFVTRKGENEAIVGAIDRHLDAWKGDKGSVYYRSLKKWFGEELPSVIPSYLVWIVAAAVPLFLFALGIAYFLKWQVNLRTQELKQRNVELRKALADLNRAQKQAREQERLHVLGLMASGIAHDFNNILMVIQGHTDLLLMCLEEKISSGELRQNLRSIKRATEDAAQIVGRMKDYYRSGETSRKMEPIVVHDLLEKTMALARPVWSTAASAEGISIRIETDFRGHPVITGNRAELGEAILNLILNAIDAMPAGGTVTLSTRSDGDVVWISVSDTGDGMSEDVRANCTRPFYTTKGPGGSGMGLTMVEDIVERYGGKLSIESAVGKGTVITLIFPLQPPPPEEKAEAPSVRPLKILAVDDDPRFLDSLVSLLEHEGHSVDVALRPEDALGMIKSASYDVALVDLAMPEMSGVQFISRIRKEGHGLPVIVITGTLKLISDLADVRKQVSYILEKPISIRRLREAFFRLGFR